jgi:CheY-like chemotaxis protein
MQQGGRLTVATMDVALDEVTARRWELPPGSYVRMTVSDSGIGMTEAVRQRIFEPFFTTKAGGEVSGTGLGLSTVYGVVHLHRGAIRVESRPGAGTTFTVLLPQGTLCPSEQTLAPAPARGSGCILVVEDEEMLRRLATTALTRLGYSTITASDGVEAVQLFDAHHHALSGVLLDLKMPRKAGRDTFVEMRAIDATVPVLLCSGYGENEEAQSLISMGAVGLLSKPYRIGELSELLARFRR